MLEKPPPVLVADRFPMLLDALLRLLNELSAEEWQRPVHEDPAGWTVKDLAGHLLGDEVNILSGMRDGYRENTVQVDSWDELVALINQRNAAWVEAMRRISPRVLCELLRWSGDQVNAYLSALNMNKPGGEVSWAGPGPAPNWLVVAREYTERWHHQQHIRAAVGKPGCMEAYFLAPVLATFVRALPRAFQGVEAPEGTQISLSIPGEAGGDWTVVSEPGGWQLYAGGGVSPQAAVELPADTAWRLFTRGIIPGEAREQAKLSGDLLLAERVLEAVAIIA